MSGNQNIIIIKKKKGGHAGHHGGAWKVAFADFMTAMMAFFMVMWLIAMKQDVKAAIAAYFRDPGVFETTKGALVGGGAGTLNGTPNPTTAAITEDAARRVLEQAGKRIRDKLAADMSLKGLGKQVEIQMTKEGLRIELVDTAEAMFFDSGSSHVKGETERMLAVIAHELGDLNKPVIVEGHTDSLPYSNTNEYTNWDLSADRANAARRIMQASGLRPEQVQLVRGFADRQLRIGGAPLDPRNRRVSIVVPFEPDAKPKS